MYNPYIGFWLIPKVLTLNDLELLNGRHFASFCGLPKAVAFEADHVKLTELNQVIVAYDP